MSSSSAPVVEIVALDAVEIVLGDYEWRFAAERRADIDAHFAALRRIRSGVWNGRILLLRDHALEGRMLRGVCFETGFAELCAWRDWQFPDRSVYNFFGVAALRAADGAFLVGEMARATANAGMLYFPCGTPEPDDMGPGGRVDLAGSVARELVEETGIDIAGLDAAPGWTLVRDGGYLALLKEVTAPVGAEELRAHILHFLAGERRPELSDIRIVRSPADFGPTMPRFVTAFLAHFWS
jgi:8-oxo-dGTP pyrophosphatase MutT (NUDIX family)